MRLRPTRPFLVASVLGLCGLQTGCYSYRFSYVSDAHSGAVMSSSSHGARISVASDSRLLAGIIVAVLLAEGVRYYLRGPDGTLTPLERAPEADPSRRISEQDCTQPIARDGGNLRCR